MSYKNLPVSDGTGDPALIHVSAARLPGATTIVVDSVSKLPTDFVATYGALGANGLITAASKRDFIGHVSGVDIIIDGFAPGSTDDGNAQGDVIIIKPNTHWSNEMVRLARVSHADDGTIKAGVVGNLQIADNSVSATKMDLSTFGYMKLWFAGPAQGGGGNVFAAGNEDIITFDGIAPGSKGGLTKPFNGQIQVNTAGVYQISAALAFADAPNSTVIRLQKINAAGSTYYFSPWNRMTDTGNNRGIVISNTVYLEVNDRIMLRAVNIGTGSTRYNWWSSRDECHITVARIS